MSSATEEFLIKKRTKVLRPSVRCAATVLAQRELPAQVLATSSSTLTGARDPSAQGSWSTSAQIRDRPGRLERRPGECGEGDYATGIRLDMVTSRYDSQ